MPTSFSANASCTGDKYAVEWLSNGDVRLFVTVTVGGVEKVRRPFTFTVGGRVLDGAGNDIAAVPSGFASALSTFGGRLDIAVAALCGAGKCDP